MLRIYCNSNYKNERDYIYNLVFKDFWGLETAIIYENRVDLKIVCGENHVTIADCFFQQDEKFWLKKESLPKQPLRVIDLGNYYEKAAVEGYIPVIYGDNSKKELTVNRYFTVDVFGSAFFMLTRYEEVVTSSYDNLGRFSARSSLAFQEGFLLRPIINEYLDLLLLFFKKNGFDMEISSRKFSIMATHDCDSPFLITSYRNIYEKLRSLAGDILVRKNLSLFFSKSKLFLFGGDYSIDPYNTFSTIVKLNNKYNLTGTFFFMTSRGRNPKDGCYDIDTRPVIDLIAYLKKNNQLIGLHPGFGTYLDEKKLESDFKRIQSVLTDVQQNTVGGRQHYLQWRAPITWEYYEKVGLVYDTTLSYADHIGFRCGICYPYRVYNVHRRRSHNLTEIPLEIMECSGLDEKYMNLSVEEMRTTSLYIKNTVKKYGGVFTILWHNTRFINREEIELYEDIIKG